MLDLKQSMELAGESLLAVLDPEHDRAPTGGWLVTHDTGRWWDAMLRLEAATGFAIPARLEGAMLGHLDRFTDNPDGLLLVPPDLAWAKPRLEIHSLREALLAFSALVRYRGSRWAGGRARRMLEGVGRILRSDGTLDEGRLLYARHVAPAVAGSGHADHTGNTGRLIEALVGWHELSGDPLALALAEPMAEYHLAHTTTAGGSLPDALSGPANMGHSHSYLGTLRGLLLYGLLTRQQRYVERVAAAYRYAVPQVVNQSGWNAHDLGQVRFRDRLGNPVPETATAGDAAQLGMWLALRAGYTEFLDAAQRLVLSRLLPSQVLPTELAPDEPNAAKLLGAYGGVHALPHGGKSWTIDVTAAVLHTLTDVYRHILTQDGDRLAVHFALDYAGDAATVQVARGDELSLTVTSYTASSLLIRVPAWAPRDSIRLTEGDRLVALQWVGSYLLVDGAQMRAPVCLRYTLPAHRTVERTATGAEYHFRWRGDQITGIYPNDEPHPFYPTDPTLQME